jgi:hypothetical protein
LQKFEDVLITVNAVRTYSLIYRSISKF